VSIVAYSRNSNTLQAGEIGEPDNPDPTWRNHLRIITRSCYTEFQIQGGQVSAWRLHRDDCSIARYP